MRFVFLDEAGISQREPWAVVAGVIVHGDSQVIPLEEYLNALIEKNIPEEQREDFLFHATDIWSGTGKVFSDREKWPPPKRYSILHDLVRIPHELRIPIIHYGLQKERVQFEDSEDEKFTARQKIVAMHGMAFAGCTLRIEEHMREVWPSEIAQLVAEDNPDARAIIKRGHEVIRHPLWLKKNNIGIGILPLQRIRGSVQFASKSESYPLQLADVCAFFIRGFLARNRASFPFYRMLRKWMLLLPREQMWPTTGSFVVPWRASVN